jgi:RNA polymerase sigma factor (TIGR02999 family)
MSDITRLLEAAEDGDRKAAELLPVVYNELRRLAAARMAGESPEHTLQPTALVHEAYLRLIGRGNDHRWVGRGHFFAAASEAMRRILIDKARRKRRKRHGGDRKRVPIVDQADPEQREAEQLLALDEALKRLATKDAQAAKLVQLHTFGGLSVTEAGAHLGLSRAAAYREWAYARAWLRSEIGGDFEKR